MNDKNDVYKKQRVNSSVNPQGFTEDEADQRPNTKPEDKAKKTNTKR